MIRCDDAGLLDDLISNGVLEPSVELCQDLMRRHGCIHLPERPHFNKVRRQGYKDDQVCVSFCLFTLYWSTSVQPHSKGLFAGPRLSDKQRRAQPSTVSVWTQSSGKLALLTMAMRP